MKQQTIYFLQALWDANVQRDELTQITKEASLYEINHILKGVSDSRTLWISERARSLKRQSDTVRAEIEQLSWPHQLIGINREYQKLAGEIQALQIKTIKTLSSPNGPNFEEMHIVVKQLVPFALKKVREQVCFQIYRMLVLNGNLPDMRLYPPFDASLEAWVNFYKNKLGPMFEQLEEGILDGRWAYERKKVTLNHRIQLEQFVAEKPEREEVRNVIGRPQIGTGEKGHLRISGRGYLTNLSPWDLVPDMNLACHKELTFIKDYFLVDDENRNPAEILDSIFGHEKYLIAPEKYFELINKRMIADTFYHRIQLGACLYCGAPLYHNRCPECERI